MYVEINATEIDKDDNTYYYTLVGLKPNETYYIRISAMNEEGYGVSVFTKPYGIIPKLSPPGIPRVKLSRNKREVTVEIEPPLIPFHGLKCFSDNRECPNIMGKGAEADGGSFITNYKIDYSTYSDFRDIISLNLPQPLVDVDGIETRKITIKLNNGVKYYFRVFAENKIGTLLPCERDENGDRLVVDLYKDE